MPYQHMTDVEVRVFLTDGTRTAKLATTRANGDPHVAPVWFVVDDDGTIVFNTGVNTVKGRNIQRNPRVSLCVDDETPPFSFVVIDGTAETSEDPDELRTTASRIGGRYMGEDRAEEYGRRNGVPGELIVRVRPTRITSAKDLAE